MRRKAVMGRRATPYPRNPIKQGNEEVKEQAPIPPRERVNTQGFDVGAEHASGWSIKETQPKPLAPSDESNITGKDALIIRDAGEVNRVQYERIKELNMPLSDNAAQALPVTIRSGDAPDFNARDSSDDINLALTSIVSPVSSINALLDEGQKMGLKNSHTNEMYGSQARKIRTFDRHVGSMIKTSLAVDLSLAETAADLQSPDAVFIRPRNVNYNPLVAPGQTYRSQQFKPKAAIGTMDVEDVMPGSASVAYVQRVDSIAGNGLEKLVVSNPLATQNALNQTIFNPRFRNQQQQPSIMQQSIRRR